MKALANLLLLACLALYIVFMAVRQPEYFQGTEYEIHVTNGFRTNSSTPLVIWCSSEEDDLGGRALQEGEEFSWELRIDFWGTVQFSCTVKWDRRRKRFEAFRVHRDGHRCFDLKKCFWLVTEDGIYFSSNEVSWKKDFSWS
ncbi:S-protein homolog 29-like [Malania oleifera]|uniref:S-protein homolog 29-like n=1 Tax=Malania oleifera TaxID=397392 RepID=UPI0025ADF54E|nr:S-protein homolog 29-like [Malania oleifera]